MRVACHTITWGESHLDVALKEIAELGFGAFETFASIVNQYQGKVPEFQEMLNQRNLRLISLYGGGDMHRPDAATEVIDQNVRIARFLKENSADRMVLGPARRSAEGPTSAELQQLARTANEIGKRTQEFGVLSCLHPHVYTVVESIAEINEVMEQLDTGVVGLAADTAHFAKGNRDIPGAELSLFNRYADNIKYVHLKDWDPSLPPEFDENALTPVIRDFTELGQGKVNLPGCVEVLRNANYDGWLTIELDYTRGTPKESVRMSKAYLEESLRLSV